MHTQSFKNHRRVHPLYHYIAVPFSIILIVWSAWNLVAAVNSANTIQLGLAVMIHLAAFLTRHYAKQNQDRIIRTELRQRYFELTGKRLAPLEADYSLSQLLAIRFADDQQFTELIDGGRIKGKTSTDIKREITAWQGDYMRV